MAENLSFEALRPWLSGLVILGMSVRDLGSSRQDDKTSSLTVNRRRSVDSRFSCMHARFAPSVFQRQTCSAVAHAVDAGG